MNNALRTLLILSIILYYLISDIKFLILYTLILFSYFLFSEIVFGRNKDKSGKSNFFISCWSAPYDPLAYARVKAKTSKFYSKLNELSNRYLVNVSSNAYIAKVLGLILAKHKLINSRIIFGKIVPRSSCDVSIYVSFGDKSQSEIITINNCDKKDIIEIQKEIDSKRKDLEDGVDKEHNIRYTFVKHCPSFLLSPILRISSYLSSCGLDLSWIGIPKNLIGAAIICNLESFGIEYGFLPIPSTANCPFIVSIGTKVVKYNLDDDDDNDNNNNNLNKNIVKEEISNNFNFSVDHRYIDGAYGSKMQEDFSRMVEDPKEEVLFSK